MRKLNAKRPLQVLGDAKRREYCRRYQRRARGVHEALPTALEHSWQHQKRHTEQNRVFISAAEYIRGDQASENAAKRSAKGYPEIKVSQAAAMRTRSIGFAVAGKCNQHEDKKMQGNDEKPEGLVAVEGADRERRDRVGQEP